MVHIYTVYMESYMVQCLPQRAYYYSGYSQCPLWHFIAPSSLETTGFKAQLN